MKCPKEVRNMAGSLSPRGPTSMPSKGARVAFGISKMSPLGERNPTKLWIAAAA